MKNTLSTRNCFTSLLAAVIIYTLSTPVTVHAEYPQNIITPSIALKMSGNAADVNLNALTTLGGHDRAIFFIDPGWTTTENWRRGGSSRELNLGTGIRLFTPNMFSTGAIIGGSMYYDKKWTVNDNTYNQLGLGGELLSEYFDARINAFLPTSNRKSVKGSGRQTHFSQIAVHSKFKDDKEYAFSGYTTEFGFRLPFEKDLGIFRVFGGYDSFRASGISNVATWKIKATYSPTQYIQFAFNYYFDHSLYNSHWMLGVNASIPLDWGGFRMVDRYDRSEPVSRMHERTVRW